MDLFSKAKAFASRGLMGAGGVLRKFGDVGAPIIRKIGSVAGAVKPAVSILGTALAPITGGASMPVAGLINKGLGVVQGLAPKAEGIASKVGGFGSTLQGLGRALQ